MAVLGLVYGVNTLLQRRESARKRKKRKKKKKKKTSHPRRNKRQTPAVKRATPILPTTIRSQLLPPKPVRAAAIDHVTVLINSYLQRLKCSRRDQR